jgi:plasmid stabilization system protein ParE
MSGYTLVFHADAVIDYDEAYYWYEDQQKGLGEKFLSAIKSKTQQILDVPEIFSVKGREGYHEAFVNGFPYTIVYRIYKRKQVIFINSLHHQKKHPRKKYRK